jgi:hypothetical protein
MSKTKNGTYHIRKMLRDFVQQDNKNVGDIFMLNLSDYYVYEFYDALLGVSYIARINGVNVPKCEVIQICKTKYEINGCIYDVQIELNQIKMILVEIKQ